MCTVITLHRPGHAFPLLLAANRDERIDRPWDAPGRHWPGQPDVTGGRDRLGGGTWMAASDRGVMAAVLNRPGSLGPEAGKRSRGDLPLLALREESAAAASARVAALNGAEFRSFNLVVADRTAVWFLRGTGGALITASLLTPGLHMVTAHDPDDTSSPRVARHRSRFAAAIDPTPPDWGSWPDLLADDGGSRAAALSVPAEGGFGTVCATLFALPSAGAAIWLFAAGQPGRTAFHPVT